MLSPANELSVMPKRPDCPKCGSTAMLARITPAGKGIVQETYECPKCDHSWRAPVADPLVAAKGWAASALKPPV
jgi:ribosomal protein S27AE